MNRVDGRLRWGILATGRIAQKFAEELAESRTGRLVAVGSRTAERAAAFAAPFPGVRAHASYAALLADPAVDVVYVATPHPWHHEWVVRAAEAGKHLLCEKPLALNRADAERMIAAAAAANVFLMEAFMYRCHPQAASLVQLIRAGAIGKLQRIEARFCVEFPFDAASRTFARELGGGAILDLGCYPVSLARLVVGAEFDAPFLEPTGLQASGRLHPLTGVDEGAAAVLQFRDGITAEVACSFTGPRSVGAVVHGTAGRIEVPAPFAPGRGENPDWLLVHRPDDDEVAKIHCRAPASLFAVEADAVGEAILAGEAQSPAMTWADSLGNMAVLDAWRAAIGVRYEGET